MVEKVYVGAAKQLLKSPQKTEININPLCQRYEYLPKMNRIVLFIILQSNFPTTVLIF